MLAKTIEFTDLDGNPLKETFYFNLSKVEATAWAYEGKGGPDALKQQIMEAIKNDEGGTIIRLFTDLITKSVGRRSDDGKRFIKNQEIRDEFMQSNAYDVLFTELLTDSEAANKFILAIIPKDLSENASNAPLSVELPQAPVSVTPNLNAAAPDFAKMSQQDFLDWQRRQSSPLGI